MFSLLAFAAADFSGKDFMLCQFQISFFTDFMAFHPVLEDGHLFIPSIDDFYSNVSNMLENELKDVDKLNAEMKRAVSRMYNAMSPSKLTEEEGRMERALFSLFENSVRQSISAFSSLERKDRTFKSQCIEHNKNLVDAVEAIMLLLTAKNEYGDDLVKVVKGDEPVSDIFDCIHK
jgi:hypothetical protein